MNTMVSLQEKAPNITTSVSFHGYEFDSESDIWTLSKEHTLNVSFIANYDQSIQDDIRATLIYFAEQRSSAHTSNLLRELKRYLITGESSFNELGLISFKSSFEKKDEYRVAVLRVFLKQLFFLGFDAVSEEIMELLNRWNLSGNEKGIAVLSLDPEEGPFSDIEFEAIQTGLVNKYAENKMNDEQYSLAQLFSATGRRAIQISSLKLGDLSIDKALLPTPTFMLSIPKAKVRGQKFRTVFTEFGLIESIGQVLLKHKKNVISSVEKIFGRQLTSEEVNLLPFFPNLPEFNNLKKSSITDVVLALQTDITHLKTSVIVANLRQVIDLLNIRSERTGRSLYITAYRFRYTLGTRAAREGAGLITLATLLDHSDTQNVNVYVANIPEHATRISNIMNNSLIRYANAFQGKVVQNEAEAKKENPAASRIRDLDNNDNIGSCGTNCFCQEYAPIACYLCTKFRPWRDAPHHLVLQQLEKERDDILAATGDLNIAAINDRAIIAVLQVMHACQIAKDSAHD